MVQNPDQKTILIAGNSELVVFGFRSELVKQLIADGNRVVTAFPVTEFGNGVDTAKQYGCEYIEIKINGHGKNPAEDGILFLNYLSLLRQVKPDVLLTFTIKPNIYASLAARICGVPYLANITGVGVAFENKGFVRASASILYRLALKKPQAVFFQNTENMDLFDELKLTKAKKILLPGSGVNLEKFEASPYPDTKDGIHFVFVARIMKKKGIRQYLDAAKAVYAKHPNAHFHILGAMSEPEYEPDIQALEKQGILTYHGLVSDVHSYLVKYHCTVHPTYYPEGMSNVLLETFASARPGIATDRAGCREIIDDGINGFLCKERDTETLIAAMEKFLALSDAEKEAMGRAAREKVEKCFDRRIVVQTYVNEIEAACGKTSKEKQPQGELSKAV